MILPPIPRYPHPVPLNRMNSPPFTPTKQEVQSMCVIPIIWLQAVTGRPIRAPRPVYIYI